MVKRLEHLRINFEKLLFIVLVFVFCITASNEVGNSLSLYKYIILAVCILEAFCKYMKNRKKNKEVFASKELKYLLCFVGVILLFSLFKSLIASKFSFRTIQEILFLTCPMIYAYLLINNLDKREIFSIMKIAFFIVFCAYILSLNLNIGAIVNALFSSSFSESTSDLESHIYSGFSLAFCTFFCYFDNKKLYKLLSLLFVIMTFKRLSIVMGVFLFILSNLNIKKINIDKRIYIGAAIFLILFAVLYYNIMLPNNVIKIENKFDIDISKLTSTRSDRLNDLMNSSYETYGFGSSTEYMYKYFYGALEMDIIKIIIELGYIPVVVLVFVYLYVGKTNLYTFSFTCFQILSLTFSSNLTSSFAWILIFVTLFLANKINNVERRKNEAS